MDQAMAAWPARVAAEAALERRGRTLDADVLIEVGDRALTFASPRDAEAAGVAMIPQELDLFPDLSVYENLYVGRARPRTRFGAFDGAAMRREARAVFARLGIDIDVQVTSRAAY